MLPEGFKIDKQIPKGFVVDSLPKGFALDKPEKTGANALTPKAVDELGEATGAGQLSEKMMTQLAGLDRQPDTPFMERHPTLWAAGKTALDMPQALDEFGQTVVSGATIGLSERAKEAGEYLSRKLFGEGRKGGATGTWKETKLPSYMKTAGKLAGAAAPISAAGKMIASPIIKTVVKSKHLAPFARMIGWGTAGATYATIEGMIKEGELPTPKEIATHGAVWAGFEAVISSLGWGGKLTLGITRLSKTWGIPKKEVLKIVTAEAKKRGMPIAKYAYSKASVQKALKIKESAKEFVESVENLSKPFEKQGTYQSLTKKLADQEIEGRIKSFKSYVGSGKIIGEKPKPTKIITKEAGEIERILQKPAFNRTAKEVMVLKKAKVDIKIERMPTKLQPSKIEKPKPSEVVREQVKGKVIPKPTVIPKKLEPLAIEARKYKNAKEFEKIINKAIADSRGGKTQESMISGLKIGDAKYSYEIGMALDKAGYKNITAFYNEATKQLKKPISKKGVTLGFGPAGELQRIYETLTGKIKSKIKLRENKYAGSINVTKQAIKQPYKEFQQEISALTPKKTQTWDTTGKLSKEIVADYKKGATVLTKAKKGQALTAVEIDAVRQINVNAINRLKEIAETKTPEQINQQFLNYIDDVFKPLSNASSEAGRALNIHKKEVSVQRIAKAFSKIKKGLNARQLKEFKELNLENPLEIQRFLKRLPDPKFRDYFYEYWYNSILSGIPTHVVNVASNTGWSLFQLGVHRPLKAILDIPIAKLTGKPRRYYLNETIPALVGYGKAFKKGKTMAWRKIKGDPSIALTKWEMEMGQSVIGAFERSPHKALRAMSPYITPPGKALWSMDVWAKTMAFDSHIAALARRASNIKGLKGEARKIFERNLILNPTEKMMFKSSEFAKHLTFTDDPGKFTEWIIQGRNKIPLARLIVPFVNTIANLTKRGVEITPAMGLTLARGKEPAKILAKQIEGAVLGLYILSKLDKFEITGATPKSKTAREAFYRQGKKPWAVKLGGELNKKTGKVEGGTWYQYRRIEPFNTVIASVAIAYNAIQNAKDDATATEIFGTMVEGLIENVLDSSYLQGVTNLLDKYGRRKGMAERTLASFVPYSSFWRSINRAYDVVTTEKTLVRDTKSLLGSFSQIIPGLSDLAPARLNVWGEEIPIEGGVFRQWLPYKWSKESPDATELMLESLGIYPGQPRQTVTIRNEKIKLPDDIYKNYCLSYGHKAKKALDKIISKPSFKNKRDILKINQLNSNLTKIRYRELQRAKHEFRKRSKTDFLPKGFVLD